MQPPQITSTIPAQPTAEKPNRALYNMVLGAIITTFAFVVVFLTILLIQENSRLISEKSALQNSISTANDTATKLRSDIDYLRSELTRQQVEFVTGDVTDDTNPTCIVPKLNIGIATMDIPCTWHGFFESRLATNIDSYGYIDTLPISVIGGSNLSEVKLRIYVTRYSTSFANYNADPVSGVVSSLTTSGKSVSQVTSPVGTVFFTYQEVDPSLGKLNVYYTQKQLGSDVYLVKFVDRVAVLAPANQTINSFRWK